jgi:hypothetical protein
MRNKSGILSVAGVAKLRGAAAALCLLLALPAGLHAADESLSATAGAAAASAQAASPVPPPPAGQAGAAASPLPQPAPEAEASSVVILDYHTFLDSKTSNIDFSLEEFASQLDAMKAMGCNFIGMEDFVTGNYKGRNNVLITIDDGNHSVYKACKEVLDPRGIRPVLFVYPAVVLGHVRFAIKEDQLRELAAEGYVVGAHGYHHNPLSNKALAKDPKDFDHEIRLPGPALERLLGFSPLYFAYPFGVYSATSSPSPLATTWCRSTSPIPGSTAWPFPGP